MTNFNMLFIMRKRTHYIYLQFIVNMSFLSIVAVTEMIEIAIDKTIRIGCGKRRDANANTNPKRTEIVTNDTRDVQWNGKRAGRA